MAREPSDQPRSVNFFEQQFQRQVGEREFALNPFERLALMHVRGRVLDLGCGLGNLAIEAARQGCNVTAVDASATGVAHTQQTALGERLSLSAFVADLESWSIDRDYDTIVAIGLLMFFPRDRALAMLDDIRRHVAPGGKAVINVLITGTTYTDLFDPEHHHLFEPEELKQAFQGWSSVCCQEDQFAAPGGKVKRSCTLVAEKPDAT
jgi:tellurite methyltransferase